MTTRLNRMLAAAAIAGVLLTGCVSSRKYKESQAALQQMRNDSTRLAQQVTSLNENVSSLQDKNAGLQRSLDSTSNNYAAQGKALDYYQSYFSQQQSAMSQVSDDIKSALSQSGLASEDVQQVNNVIYVRLDENAVFKKNSTAVTTSGKQALNSLAQAIKSKSNVNVFVNDGDSSMRQSSSGDNMASAGMSSGAMSGYHASGHRASRKTTVKKSVQGDATGSGNQDVASGNAQSNSKSHGMAHKKIHRHYPSSEGSMTYYSNMSRFNRSRPWALKQGRMNTVANSFLQNGIPKVNLTLQQPPVSGNPQNGDIKVVITPVMNDFNPQNSTSRK